MFSEVGRGTGRPARAMMLMMLAGRPQRWLLRARNDAGRRDGARVRTHAHDAGQGGEEGSGDGGGGRAPPSSRARAPFPAPPPNE